MGEGRGRVCVTGGTGFIGSWIIKRLLENGYSVNTTIRSHPEDKRDLSFLTNLPGASQKLQIFNADLSNPDSFNVAVEGCTGVFHVATPMNYLMREPEEVVTKRSIDGAIGILKACLNSSTVKRIVYTSSGTTVCFNGKDDEVMDESLWSDVDFIRASKPFAWSYAISKTLTEKAILEFGEHNGLDVVTLLPTLVVGPFICPNLARTVGASLALLFADEARHKSLEEIVLNYSVAQIMLHQLTASTTPIFIALKEMNAGNKDLYGVLFRTPLVHVDDVARAHIFLLEHPNPKGRYICSAGIITIQEIHQLLSAKYPEYQIPALESFEEIEGQKLPDLSSKKLIDYGFEFKYGVEEMFDDAIQCCKEMGYL